MNDKYSNYYKILSILLDLFLINLAGFLGYLFTYDSIGSVTNLNISLINILLINFVWFNVTQITRLYHKIFAKDAIPTIRAALGSLILLVFIISLITFVIPDFGTPTALLVVTFFIFAPMFLSGKVVFLLLRRSRRDKMIDYKDVVIVGGGPVGQSVIQHIKQNKHLGYRVMGYFDDNSQLKIDQTNYLGEVNECINFVKNNNIREVYCALPDRSIDKINTLMREADRELIRFKLVPDVKDYFKKNVIVQLFGHLPVLSPRSEPLENKVNQLVKRLFDVLFSLTVIVLIMSWLIPIMAILIKLETRGPIFFKQLRSGKDNQPFYCIKFRSMKLNGESDTRQARKDDQRITKVGAFMRRNSIDEMPQFFNVLMGEMSVVGPRPHMLQHTKEYSEIIDQYMVRHFVLPGITGWAQVRGLRGETKEDGAMEERVKADIWYLENWSLLLDLKIVFLTCWQLIVGQDNVF